MIEKILKKRARTFQYGEIMSVNSAEGKVLVQIGDGSIWIETALSLETGDSVIVARNEDSSKFIVQYSRKALPSQGALLLLGIILAMVLLFTPPVSAQRYFVATAFDTDGYESAFSNEVEFSGGGRSVTFEWSPNSEPYLAGYRLWCSKVSGGPYVPAGSYIDCSAGDAACCTETLAIESPKNIRLKGD